MIMDSGAFTLSLDTELIWGVVHWTRKEHERSVSRAREVIGALLSLMDQYDIPATWAIVGHLFLDSCRAENGKKHPDMPRPGYSWLGEDWYEVDPCTDIESDPHFYGRDIVEGILAAGTRHEIGCHSFSHPIFGEMGCTKEVAEAELKKCRALARDFGVELKTMVFPQNSVAYLDVLKDNGFSCYRGMDPLWYNGYPKTMQKVIHPLDVALATNPPVVEPEEVLPGLWNIPGSMLYLSCDGIRNAIPVSSRVAKAKKGIDRAIRQKRIFHLWFHPFNLASRMHDMLEGIESIFRYVNEKKETGEIEVKTMQEYGGGRQ